MLQGDSHEQSVSTVETEDEQTAIMENCLNTISMIVNSRVLSKLRLPTVSTKLLYCDVVPFQRYHVLDHWGVHLQSVDEWGC